MRVFVFNICEINGREKVGREIHLTTNMRQNQQCQVDHFQNAIKEKCNDIVEDYAPWLMRVLEMILLKRSQKQLQQKLLQ